MFDGEVLEAFDFTARVQVQDRSWTKTLGIVDDDGNVIWLCTVDGVKAIWKRSPIKHELHGKTAWFSGGWHRNQRAQVFVDECKPVFGLPKIGCSLAQDPAGRWGVLMRYQGDGRNLTDLPMAWWTRSPVVIPQLVRTALLDLWVGNNNRLKRNFLWLGEARGVLAIDEEKALDFDGLVTWRMDQEARVALYGGMKAFDIVGEVRRLRSALTRSWLEGLAGRLFMPEHVGPLVDRLLPRLEELVPELWRYVGSRYADGKALGVKSKRQRGPQPWDGY